MNKPGKYREKEMSNVSDPAFEGIFEEAPDIAEIIASLDGRVCDVAGDTEVFIVLDVDTNDARTAYINLSFIDSDLERSEVHDNIRA